VITQIHPIAIIFTLPEDQLPQVQQAMRSGRKLVVEAYDRTDAHKIASGTLLTIDNQIDTTTGTAKLKAVFDNSDGSLFANQFVNVRLILSQRANATVVPTAAIESGNQGDYVFVVNTGPTPADKLKNLPGATPANTSSGAAASNSTHAGASGGEGGDGENGGKNAKPRQQFHADVVPVHVDFTIGTSSVLSTDTALKPGEQVVVDGQEKLVDGGNVTPSQAHSIPATNNGGNASPSNPSAAASPPAAGSGGLTNASPVPADSGGGTSDNGQGTSQGNGQGGSQTNGQGGGHRNGQNANQSAGQSAPANGGGSH
jgi:multidrug efflux system membrane fusion protein